MAIVTQRSTSSVFLKILIDLHWDCVIFLESEHAAEGPNGFRTNQKG
jgi:hypothetical protein